VVNVRALILGATLALVCGCPSSKPCKVQRDCSATQRCVQSVCHDESETKGAVGDSCAAADQCGGGLTCLTESSGYPAGICTSSCASAACATGKCAPIASGPVCLATCASDNDCRASYACCPSLGSVCVPPAACPPPPSCQEPVVASVLPAAQVIALGSHKVGEELTFDVPANTGSVTIVHQAKIANAVVVYKGSPTDNNAAPVSVKFPSGALAYDDFADYPTSSDGGIDFSGRYAVFGGSAPITAAFTLPNTAASLDAGIPPGAWKFTVGDVAYECTFALACDDGGTPANVYDVSVLLRPQPQGNNLDVDFYVVADMTTRAGLPFTAANAPGDASVQRMLQTFAGIYASAGITVRTVNFYDVSAVDQARFGTNVSSDATGPCSELGQMFTLSSAHAGNTMNLFLTQSIRTADQAGGSVVGIDGSVPGPASMNGTIHSGAAVSAADLFSGSCGGSPDLACGADLVAFIAAHETGHFLGLFHTTEAPGTFYDPLSDTLKCPCALCASAADKPHCDTQIASNPVFMPANLCTTQPNCGGGSNLMFWQLQRGVSQGLLSAQQASVMRLNPLIQ
jgi:hypothetical protein